MCSCRFHVVAAELCKSWDLHDNVRHHFLIYMKGFLLASWFPLNGHKFIIISDIQAVVNRDLKAQKRRTNISEIWNTSTHLVRILLHAIETIAKCNKVLFLKIHNVVIFMLLFISLILSKCRLSKNVQVNTNPVGRADRWIIIHSEKDIWV